MDINQIKLEKRNNGILTANHMVRTKHHGWRELNSLQTGASIMTDKGFKKITEIHHYKPKRKEVKS